MSSISGKGRVRKGKTAEREFFNLLSDYLGEDVRRSLESSRDGGADNEREGILADWAIEIKRQDSAKLTSWWAQALEQGVSSGLTPALAYRLPRRPWRVRVLLSTVHPGAPDLPEWHGLEWTVDMSLEAFAFVVRERMPIPPRIAHAD